MIPPVVPQNRGVIASIRRQSRSEITRQQLLDSDSASADMLDFLTLCLCNGISIGLAGSTGSGKTTDEAFLLNEYIRKNDDYNNRVFVIEDSRELRLTDYDIENDRPARVLYSVTKDPPNPISMLDLIVSSLRFSSFVACPGRGPGCRRVGSGECRTDRTHYSHRVSRRQRLRCLSAAGIHVSFGTDRPVRRAASGNVCGAHGPSWFIRNNSRTTPVNIWRFLRRRAWKPESSRARCCLSSLSAKRSETDMDIS